MWMAAGIGFLIGVLVGAGGLAGFAVWAERKGW